MPFPSPINDTYRLEDGAAAVTADREGRVGGVARVFDCGTGTWDGYLILSITAIDVTGDKNYTIRLQASNSSTFASGVVELSAPPFLMNATGEQGMIITNRVVDTNYRYLRILIDVGGTSPSITLQAWLVHMDNLDALSISELTSVLALAANRFGNVTTEYRAWSGGVLGGGPNSDGNYPLSDGYGNTYLVPCPAKIAATSGLSFAAVNALTERTTAFANSHTGPTIPFIADSNLRKGRLFLFASRRTQDLAPVTIGDDGLNYHMQVLNTDTGISYRASINELRRTITGIIDPTLPPYNCRFDATFTRNAATENGSNVITFSEPVGRRARVGHVVQLSNAFAYMPGSATITEVIDNYRVRMNRTSDSNHSTQDCLFGTDDTAGMQAALDAAASPGTYTYGGVVWMPARMALVGALVYRARSALYGKGVRQSMLIRRDDNARAPAWYEYWQEFGSSGIPNESHPSFVPTQPAPILRAENMLADFVAMGDMALHGARYCQSLSYPGISMHSLVLNGLGISLPQVDPYPMFSRMHVIQAGWNGWEHTGHHSGSMLAVEIINCGAVGFHMAGYDANISNILVIGCVMPGMYFQGMGGNNNLLNVKLSFNGEGGGWMYGDAAYTNLACFGSGNNITNMRVQESKGTSLWVGGSGNQFADVTIDDTGCIVPMHQPWGAGDQPAVRAAIMLDGAVDNRFNDVIFGGAVHYPNNYASHGIFCRNNPQNNSGRIVSKGIPKFDDSAYYPNGHTSGALAPRVVSTSDPGGINANNTLYIDEEPLSYYYP